MSAVLLGPISRHPGPLCLSLTSTTQTSRMRVLRRNNTHLRTRKAGIRGKTTYMIRILYLHKGTVRNPYYRVWCIGDCGEKKAQVDKKVHRRVDSTQILLNIFSNEINKSPIKCKGSYKIVFIHVTKYRAIPNPHPYMLTFAYLNNFGVGYRVPLHFDILAKCLMVAYNKLQTSWAFAKCTVNNLISLCF